MPARERMVEISLECAIVGEAGTFDVTVDDGKKVSVLNDAIKEKNPITITCDAKNLRLFQSKKDGAWLEGAGAAAVTLDGDGHPQGFEQMDPTLWINNDKHFGKNFEPAEGEVHVLVVVPKQAQPQEGLSLVSGSIENALNTKGIRCRVNRLAASYLGYYDPDLRAGRRCGMKGRRCGSMFCSRKVCILIIKLRRIMTRHYVPEDTDSPQLTTSLSTTTSIVDVVTDEFKYQRIESEEWFRSVGKAQSCHLMSREHCRKYASYHKYDNDQSNRLALTSDIHAWYDGRSFDVPVMNISVESVSEGPVVESRYKVNLIVRALNAGYARLISLHLKEGFAASDDDLEMRTFVYVLKAKVFCECMEWKRKEIDKQWKSYYDMAPAID